MFIFRNRFNFGIDYMIGIYVVFSLFYLFKEEYFYLKVLENIGKVFLVWFNFERLEEIKLKIDKFLLIFLFFFFM